MYALSFDMTIAELQKHYGKNYNRAYFEIKNILKDNGFTILVLSSFLCMFGRWFCASCLLKFGK